MEQRRQAMLQLHLSDLMLEVLRYIGSGSLGVDWQEWDRHMFWYIVWLINMNIPSVRIPYHLELDSIKIRLLC